VTTPQHRDATLSDKPDRLDPSFATLMPVNSTYFPKS
jgi:hypothetical protein